MGISAAMGNYTPSGLVLVKQQDIGTAVSSITVSDAFNSDYDNYRIAITVNSNSGSNADFQFQLRTSGGTTSTTGYYNSLIYNDFGFTNTSAASGSNGAFVSFFTMFMGTQGGSATLDVMRPNMAYYTTWTGLVVRGNIGGSLTGYHAVATAYSSFVLTVSTGTVTGGTIRVYGYRN